MRYGVIVGVALAVVGCASQRPVAVRPTPMAPTVPVSQFHFATNQARVSGMQRRGVAADADWHRADAHRVLLIEGHTDAVGAAQYNLRLGDRRARNVAADLVAAGADPQRMAGVVSYGEAQPVDPAPTAAARRKNRRVEVIAW